MTRKRSRIPRPIRVAERSANTGTQNVATAVLQERANKSSARRQNQVTQRQLNRNLNAGLGYPVTVPGRALLTYNLLGNTDEGRTFALVNLHPCGEYVTNSCGIPDESQVSSVTPSFRGDSIVSMNRLYFENPPTLPSDYRYDIQLVVLPIPEIDYIFRVRVNALNTGWSRWVVRRTTYFSSEADGTAVGLLESGYSGARVVGRGITVHFDAPALADQGKLIAGQIRAPHRGVDVSVSLASVSPAETGQEQTLDPIDPGTVRRHIMYLPQEPTELTVQDVYAAQWEARFGSYIPHRYVQPVQQFTRLESGAVTTLRSVYNGPRATGANLVATTTVPKTYFSMVDNPQLRYSSDTAQKVYQPSDRTWGSATSITIPPASGTGEGTLYNKVASLTGLAENGNSTETYGFWGGSELINHYTSVQFFMGIQNTAQLHVKTRLHLECEVQAKDSAVTPFLHKSPTIDRRALDTVAYVAQNQAHVFFASDNDLSSILQSIGKILPGLLSAMQGSGIPFVENVGKVGGNIGRGLKDLLSGF